MNRKNKKTQVATTSDDHFETVGQLLTQLKKHLTESAAEKGTYADYLRLLDYYSKTDAVQPKEILVGWVDNPDLLAEPSV